MTNEELFELVKSHFNELVKSHFNIKKATFDFTSNDCLCMLIEPMETKIMEPQND